ncbi:MAG: carbohydrate ABC transporter permease [Actinobacteria bacterium]|nr:carbohydrate ABC transporter permease [Actinomycetota bacterium]
MKMRWGRKSKNASINVLKIVILSIAIFITLMPIVWIILTTFKPEPMTFVYPPVWKFKPILDNYISAFKTRPLLKYFTNSVIVTLSTTAISIVVGSMAAYSMSRFGTGGKRLGFTLLSLRFMPAIAVVIPLFLVFSKVNLGSLHLINSRLGLILAYLTFNIPVSILLLKGFFDEIPQELEEAALVDGSSHMGAIFRILLPLSLPGIVATAVFCIIFSWNEFLFALILTRAETATLPVAIMGFVTDRGLLWGEMTAASVVIVLPVLIFSIFVQRYLISGLTLGALKE